MRYNMNYAKLIDGVPSYAPHPMVLEEDILIGGVAHPAGALLCTDRPDALVALGYKQVIREEMPVLEGYYHTPTWVEDDTTITQGWEAHELPADTSTEQRLDAAEATLQTHDTEIDQIVSGLEALANG